MDFLNLLKKYWKELIIIIEIILIIILAVLLKNKKECINDEIQANVNNNEIVEISKETEENESIKIDIKGAVSKPGVYELQKNSIISDAIKIAGGLKKNADTSNINLSKKLQDEMVIKIFTNSEIKNNQNTNTINTCQTSDIIITDCKDSAVIENKDANNTTKDENKNENNKNENIENSEKPKLVSINKATLEELMTVSGIGESKAKSIIEYRNKNGNFNKIEDIMNVSGIGTSIFEKIKNYISI